MIRQERETDLGDEDAIVVGIFRINMFPVETSVDSNP